MTPEFLIAAQLTQQQESSLRVVALGTSHTARGGWQQPLADALTRCLATHVDVLNHGKSGANSHWGVTEAARISPAQPDVVLIEFAANDASLHGGVSISRSRENITTIVNELRTKRPTVRIILMAMNPVSGMRGALRPLLDRYDDLYRDLAETLHVEFVDHRPAWHTMSAGALRAAIPDGLHPSERTAAEVIVPALTERICGSRASNQSSNHSNPRIAR